MPRHTHDDTRARASLAPSLARRRFLLAPCTHSARPQRAYMHMAHATRALAAPTEHPRSTHAAPTQHPRITHAAPTQHPRSTHAAPKASTSARACHVITSSRHHVVTSSRHHVSRHITSSRHQAAIPSDATDDACLGAMSDLQHKWQCKRVALCRKAATCEPTQSNRPLYM